MLQQFTNTILVAGILGILFFVIALTFRVGMAVLLVVWTRTVKRKARARYHGELSNLLCNAAIICILFGLWYGMGCILLGGMLSGLAQILLPKCKAPIRHAPRETLFRMP